MFLSLPSPQWLFHRVEVHRWRCLLPGVQYARHFASKDETEAPIHNMIWDMKAIQLNKLPNLTEANHGTITDLSTDCVSTVCPENNQRFRLDGASLVDFHFDAKK